MELEVFFSSFILVFRSFFSGETERSAQSYFGEKQSLSSLFSYFCLIFRYIAQKSLVMAKQLGSFQLNRQLLLMIFLISQCTQSLLRYYPSFSFRQMVLRSIGSFMTSRQSGTPWAIGSTGILKGPEHLLLLSLSMIAVISYAFSAFFYGLLSFFLLETFSSSTGQSFCQLSSASSTSSSSNAFCPNLCIDAGFCPLTGVFFSAGSQSVTKISSNFFRYRCRLPSNVTSCMEYCLGIKD